MGWVKFLSRCPHPHLSPCPYGCGWVGTGRATNLVYPGRPSLGSGDILKVKATAANAPHPHVVHHHWPLGDDEAKLPHVSAHPPAPREPSGQGGQTSGHRPGSQDSELTYLSTKAAPKSPARGEHVVAGCCWADTIRAQSVPW